MGRGFRSVYPGLRDTEEVVNLLPNGGTVAWIGANPFSSANLFIAFYARPKIEVLNGDEPTNLEKADLVYVLPGLKFENPDCQYVPPEPSLFRSIRKAEIYRCTPRTQ